MITVQEAKTKLRLLPFRPKIIKVPLEAAFRHILARTIFAAYDNPPFPQSAVDGYAFRFSDLKTHNPFEIIDEIQAGAYSNKKIKAGQTVRIFTGAEIPSDCDTVIMQEFTNVNDRFVNFNDPDIRSGANYRKQAEQIRKGEVALAKGQLLNASAIAYLASIGIHECMVYAKVNAHIIVSGNELIPIGKKIKKGQIYESNGLMLKLLLQEMGISADYSHVKDDPAVIQSCIQENLKFADLLIITGGVSVGDYDFTQYALNACQFKTVFHKVAQKPGKPILFAQRNRQFAFGLPGNPRSAVIGFYEYIYPFIRRMMGFENPELKEIRLPLAHSFKKKADKKTHIMTAVYDNQRVQINNIQASHMLQSFATAELLVHLEEDRDYSENELVRVYLLPGVQR